MSFNHNVVCDNGEDCEAHNGPVCQSFSFDHDGETMLDVKRALRGVGWSFTHDDRALCPCCAEAQR